MNKRYISLRKWKQFWVELSGWWSEYSNYPYCYTPT